MNETKQLVVKKPDKVAQFTINLNLIKLVYFHHLGLSNILQRLEKKEIIIITTSFFIQESNVYKKILKIFLSYLCPGKQVFVYF